MQVAKHFMEHATDCTEYAFNKITPLKSASSTLPASLQEIHRYVEQLLTPSEQAICDKATD